MTYPVVVMPDATDVVVSYLQGILPAYGEACPVRAKVPTTRPAKFVVVRRVGGVRRNVVTDEPMMVVESWAQSDQDAIDLAELCRGLIHSLPGSVVDGVPIYRVTDVSGTQFLPDDLSAQPRYTMTIQVAMRGVPVEPTSS
jgi:hypothetical protein